MNPIVATWAIVFSCGLTGIAGCTHVQLRWNTVRQNSTLSDIQCQQVMDNIARFVANPAAMPSFAYAGTGSTQVSNTGAAGPLLFQWTVPAQQSLSLQAQHGVTETWNLMAVNNPEKLYAMRCGYQILLAASFDQCDDCVRRLAPFLVSPNTKIKDADEQFNWQVSQFVDKIDCYLPRGWFHVGTHHDVPRCACYVSRYADTFVWVLPNGLDGLTKVTLTMLDIATLSAFLPVSAVTTGSTNPPAPFMAPSGGGAYLRGREPVVAPMGPTYVPTFPH